MVIKLASVLASHTQQIFINPAQVGGKHTYFEDPIKVELMKTRPINLIILNIQ